MTAIGARSVVMRNRSEMCMPILTGAVPILLTAYIVAAMAWTLLSLWLSARQIACVRRHRDRVPADFAASVTLDEHRKAAHYTVARERLAGVCTVWDLVISLAWVLGGINLLYGAVAAAL